MKLMVFRPNPSSDRHAYVPPQMKQAMAEHMQKSVPAHLKNYQQDGRAFIPTHVEKAIVDHMQKSVPAHMKDYVGAYVQQNVVFPNTAAQTTASTMAQPPRRSLTARPPVPQIPRQSGYSRPFNNGPSTLELLKSAQATGAPLTNLPRLDEQPTGQVPNTGQPIPGNPVTENLGSTPAVANSPYPYDFIMNPDQPQPPKTSLLPTTGDGSRGLAVRMGLVAGGLLVLLILFSVVRGLLSGNSNQPQFLSVAQDQQVLIHLTATAAQQQNLSSSNSNFAATAQLSLTTARSDTIAYLGKLGLKKIDAKVLNSKLSPQTDKQLADAAVAATYNETFRDVMKTKLNSYKQDLQNAYNKTTGPQGRKLLSNQFDQAELLLLQLEHN